MIKYIIMYQLILLTFVSVLMAESNISCFDNVTTYYTTHHTTHYNDKNITGYCHNTTDCLNQLCSIIKKQDVVCFTISKHENIGSGYTHISLWWILSRLVMISVAVFFAFILGLAYVVEVYL